MIADTHEISEAKAAPATQETIRTHDIHDTHQRRETNDAVAVLRGRRSVGQPRLVQGRPADHAVVLAAIESARWAPNHKRTEPWRFYLLDPDRIRRLAELNAALLERDGASPEKVALKRAQWGEAPGVLVITVRSEAGASEVTRREDYAASACAAQNFMLHLWSEGVASKWSTSAVWRHEDFWPLLGRTASADAPEEVVGFFFHGVVAPTEVPEGRRRLPLGSVLTDFRRERA